MSVKTRFGDRFNARLERYLPEQRLFLKSNDGTRFVRLRPTTQALALVGTAAFVGWTVIVTAFFLLNTMSSGSARDQAVRATELYESRLDALSRERDARAAEAEAAREQFYTGLEQVSIMQEQLLLSDARVKELETGIEVIQATLRRTIKERDEARDKADLMLAELETATGSTRTAAGRMADAEATMAFLTDALDHTALVRDEALIVASAAEREKEALAAKNQLMAERNARIFGQIEEAMEVAIKPLERAFNAAGLPTDRIIEEVRRGYSGTGGPLTPISFSTKGDPLLDAETDRANGILRRMSEIDIYREAAERAPLGYPVRAAHRLTSGFGPRWGRMHNGMDFAGAHATPIYATADGIVKKAGWSSGFGKLVIIQHDFGFETYYAHNTRMRVKPGQRVSRGQHISDMGSTGRSTGTHLHYEIRRNGRPLNPKTFINAGRNVF